MLIRKICILGGTGFVGRTLANRLVKDGYQIKILTRDREANKENLILLPNLQLVEANVYDTNQLIEQFSDCDAVINLIGILNEHGTNGSGFHAVHVELMEKIIRACRENSIRRLLQMSALNADASDGPSHYLRTKGAAENIAHAATGIHVTSFRPSIIFGPGDSFFNRFAHLLKLTPVFFPLACPRARFAPIYVEDVAEAFARSIKNPETYGKRFDLCGPHAYTFEDLVRYTATCAGLKRKIIPLPDLLSQIQATLFDLMGFGFHLLGMEKPFSRDNYLSTKTDSVCNHNDLQILGITPTPLEGVVPQYLGHTFQRARYDTFRQSSRRHN